MCYGKDIKISDNMKLFFGLLMALPVLGMAQAGTGNGFTITGSVKGLADNSKVFLTDASNPTDTLAESAVKCVDGWCVSHRGCGGWRASRS